MKYWLMKSEPEVFSIDDLKKNKTTHWDGVRNYQARNFMKNEMKIGDKVLFYHSNADPSAAVGVAEVIKEGYADHTQFDPEDNHYFPSSDPKDPIWFMVDIKFVAKFKKPVPLGEIKKNPKLKKMKLIKRGNRLSVMPVEKNEFEETVKMGSK
ncbi:MAG: EVE domain-containing protein [Ignavibacteria bacterium]|nr:EVE domain-containing protein [Ignavibacteria bacterium]